jgi:DNA invertase Pin-like site-specific DNA recombinase
MQTIAYLRVSTGGQDLAQQRLAILDYARTHRLTVDDVVEARGSAGSPAQRAQLLELLEALHPGDRLMVSEVNCRAWEEASGRFYKSSINCFRGASTSWR